MKKRIISILLIGAMMLQTLNGSVPVYAAEQENETEEVEAVQEEKGEDIAPSVNSIQLYQQVLSCQNAQGCFETETVSQNVASTSVQNAISFATRTLLVTATQEPEAMGAVEIMKMNPEQLGLMLNPDVSLYVMLYDSEEATGQAYEAYQAMVQSGSSVVLSVAADEINSIADTEEPEAENTEEADTETSVAETTLKYSALYNYIEENRTDAEVEVAVIDTGLDKSGSINGVYGNYTHRIIDTGMNLSSSGNPNDIQDDNGHGTYLAELILKETTDNIKLMPIKAANQNGQATVLGTCVAVQEAVTQGANVILISMNGRSASSSLLRETIERAVQNNVAVVVSAGNYGMDASGFAPADVEAAIVVSAVENGSMAEYSNYGNTIDVCADGMYLTTDTAGNEQILHGTSYSAAYVAAKVALLKTCLQDNVAISDVFTAYAQDLGNEGKDSLHGSGYIGTYVLGGAEEGEPHEKEENKENENNIEHEWVQPEITQEEFFLKNGFKQVTDENYLQWLNSFSAENLGISALTVSKGYHLGTHSGKHAVSMKRHETIPNLNCGICGATGTVTAERWNYGFTCGWETWIYAWAYTNYVCNDAYGNTHSWGEIIIAEPDLGTEYLTAAQAWTATFDITESDAYRAAYYATDAGKEASCPGYPVANTYTMKYDKNGGTGSIASDTVSYKQAYAINGTDFFTKAGYTMTGYYIKRKSDEKVWGGSTNGWIEENPQNEKDNEYKLYQPGASVTVGNALVSDDTSLKTDTFTFTATWEKNEYVIKYDKNGGSGSVMGGTVLYGEKYTISPATLTKEGHNFKGYYIRRKSDGKVWGGSTNGWIAEKTANESKYTLYQPGKTTTYGTALLGDNPPVTGSVYTYVAFFSAKSYTVIYNANGGTIRGSTATTTTKSVVYGTSVPLTVQAVPTDSYYTFIGWGTSANAKEPIDSKIMGAGNITLYALYSPPVSDVKEVYLLISDSTGKTSKNGNKEEKILLTRTASVNSPIKGYNYKLQQVDFKTFFPNSNVEKLGGTIYAEDYAGNRSEIETYGHKVIPANKYDQTVKHLFQNLDKGVNVYEEIGNYTVYHGTANEAIRATTVVESIEEGQNYTPKALTAPLPSGYQFNSTKSTGINKAYKVTKEVTTYAYYDAIAYTLTFHPNDGAIEGMAVNKTKTKSVYYGKPYGYMAGGSVQAFPMVEREGYTFKGWYTSETGGTQVTPSTLYKLTAHSTIYAQWTINSYEVIYDYWTNGGSKIQTANGQNVFSVQFGSAINLSYKATKSGIGWKHIGWHTDPNATTPLTALNMTADLLKQYKDHKVILYAIYKKDITVTYVDKRDISEGVPGEGILTTRNTTQTIYNLETDIQITLPKLNEWTGWEAEGWCVATYDSSGAEQKPGAATAVTNMAEAVVQIGENTTFYGRYHRDITVSYDTNGSPQQIQSETKKRYYNASDVYLDPAFIVAQAPTLPNNSFVCWTQEQTDIWGNPVTKEYVAGQHVVFAEDALLVAKWDEYPEIGAHDRYFTLQQAQAGEITPEELLNVRKVKGMDKEDGTLTNGTDVIMVNYNADDFQNFATDGGVSVTYRATDSFGNVTEKMIMVYIVDTAVKASPNKKYIRFISNRFYKQENEYVTSEAGGLEEKSVWKWEPAYSATLNNALTTEEPIDNWSFSKEQIEEVKAYIRENGLGNYQNRDGIGKFLQLFNKCRF